MGFIFEEERKGLEGEPARARVAIKLAAISWGLSFILWETGLPILKMLGFFATISAWAWTARGLFNLITVSIVRLPKEAQGLAQIAVALVGAVVPLIFLASHDVYRIREIFAGAFEPLARHLLLWPTFGIFVYIIYIAVQNHTGIVSLVKVRGYLVLTLVSFLIVYIGAHGGFTTYDDDYSSSVEGLDPESIEGQMDMASSYLRLIILGYGALLFSDLRQRFLSKKTAKALDWA